jgi:hypothetical protein
MARTTMNIDGKIVPRTSGMDEYILSPLLSSGQESVGERK